MDVETRKDAASAIKAAFSFLLFKRFGNEWLFLACGLMAGLAAAAGQLGHLHWLLDLPSHFVVQCFVALTLCGAALLLLRRRLWALLLLPFWVLCLIVESYCFLPPDSGRAQDGTKPYRIMAFNVLVSNKNYDGVAAFIEKEEPDFVVLLEFGNEWKRRLGARLSPRYRTFVCEARDDYMGIAVFGRYDAKVAAKRLEGWEAPVFVMDFSLDGGRGLRLVSMHPPPPRGGELYRLRNETLSAGARLCREWGGPSMMAGDFNLAPSSPLFRRLLKEGAFKDSARGCGPRHTWPSWLALLPLWVRIDHCLAGPGVEVVRYRNGPRGLGSDHLPVIVDFRLAD